MFEKNFYVEASFPKKLLVECNVIEEILTSSLEPRTD